MFQTVILSFESMLVFGGVLAFYVGDCATGDCATSKHHKTVMKPENHYLPNLFFGFKMIVFGSGASYFWVVIIHYIIQLYTICIFNDFFFMVGNRIIRDLFCCFPAQVAWVYGWLPPTFIHWGKGGNGYKRVPRDIFKSHPPKKWPSWKVRMVMNWLL